MNKRTYWIVAAPLIAVAAVAWHLWTPAPRAWSEDEIAILQTLWIGNLPELPSDPSNAYADDDRAASFGHELFFSTALSPSGAISCATCHRPELNFTDGLQQARGLGRA